MNAYYSNVVVPATTSSFIILDSNTYQQQLMHPQVIIGENTFVSSPSLDVKQQVYNPSSFQQQERKEKDPSTQPQNQLFDDEVPKNDDDCQRLSFELQEKRLLEAMQRRQEHFERMKEFLAKSDIVPQQQDSSVGAQHHDMNATTAPFMSSLCASAQQQCTQVSSFDLSDIRSLSDREEDDEDEATMMTFTTTTPSRVLHVPDEELEQMAEVEVTFDLLFDKNDDKEEEDAAAMVSEDEYSVLTTSTTSSSSPEDYAMELNEFMSGVEWDDYENFTETR